MTAHCLTWVNQLFVRAWPLEWMSDLVEFPTSAAPTKHPVGILCALTAAQRGEGDPFAEAP